jgi:hypothetical protein
MQMIGNGIALDRTVERFFLTILRVWQFITSIRFFSFLSVDKAYGHDHLKETGVKQNKENHKQLISINKNKNFLDG